MQGGKSDKGSYKVSGGLHGVGVSCVNALSTHMMSQVFRNGHIYQQEYEKGKPLHDVKIVGDTDKTGTRQQFWPDSTIFTTTEYKYDNHCPPYARAGLSECRHHHHSSPTSVPSRRAT